MTIPLIKFLQESSYNRVARIGNKGSKPALYNLIYSILSEKPGTFVQHFESIGEVRPVIRFELAIILDSIITDILLYRKQYVLTYLADTILYKEPENLKNIKGSYPPFKSIKKFKVPKKIITFLPEKLVHWLLKIDLFTIRSLELSLGSLSNSETFYDD